MRRIEELTLKRLDDELSPSEADELARLIEEDEEARRLHLGLMEVEAALRSRHVPEGLASSVIARLKDEQEGRLSIRVLDQIKGDLEGAIRLSESPAAMRRARRVGWPRIAKPLALAASVVLLLAASVWFFGPAMEEPVLAAVKGEVRLERVGQPAPGGVHAAIAGIRLLPGDVLMMATNAAATIAFGTERTSFELGSGTTLRFTSLRGGKQFELREGRLEAEVARQRPFAPLVVTTPNAAATVVGTRFKLTATKHRTRLDVVEGEVRLADTFSTNVRPVTVPEGQYAVVAAGTELAALPQTGGITREWWTGIVGGAVHDLMGDERYPVQPDGREVLSTMEWGLVSTNDYGCRIHGYVHPRATGDHVFWIAGGGEAWLFLSLGVDPQEKFRIGICLGVEPRQWDKELFRGISQVSTPVHLVAGRCYYIEAVVKVRRGVGHLSVAWQQPGGERELLTGEYLSTATNNP